MPAGFTYKLCKHDFRIVPTCVFIYQHIFHHRVKTDLQDDFVQVFLAARAMNSENCQLCYELSQLRTTYFLPTQTFRL